MVFEGRSRRCVGATSVTGDVRFSSEEERDVVLLPPSGPGKGGLQVNSLVLCH
jgi:hypothetical protein